MQSNSTMKLALGTVQFGLPYGIANKDGQVTLSAAKTLLQLAESKGIDTLDTAISYGESETCLGEIGTKGFKVVTKLPPVPAGQSNINDWVRKQVNNSLNRLGLKTVYGLLLHHPQQLLQAGGQTLYNSLRDLQASGLVQKIGVSIYSPSELDSLIPRYRLDLIQAPLNLIDRRLVSSGWLQRLKQEGTEIHTRSAFLQGLLLMPRQEIPSKFAPWEELWDKWHNWLACTAVTAVEGSLAYPLSFPEVDRVVVGADNLDHLKQILEAACGDMPKSLPDLCCEDENLINPVHWPLL